MAALNKPFNPTQHEAMADFSPLPAGEYLAHIIKSTMKHTKNKDGQYLELEFEIDTPGYTDRKVWTRLNLVNKNAAAVQIAERELKSICDAIGVGIINDSDLLHGKPLIVKLKVEPATTQYSPSNTIVAYKSSGNTPQQTQIPGMQGDPNVQAAPAIEKPAWAG